MVPTPGISTPDDQSRDPPRDLCNNEGVTAALQIDPSTLYGGAGTGNETARATRDHVIDELLGEENLEELPVLLDELIDAPGFYDAVGSQLDNIHWSSLDEYARTLRMAVAKLPPSALRYFVDGLNRLLLMEGQRRVGPEPAAPTLGPKSEQPKPTTIDEVIQSGASTFVLDALVRAYRGVMASWLLDRVLAGALEPEADRLDAIAKVWAEGVHGSFQLSSAGMAHMAGDEVASAVAAGSWTQHIPLELNMAAAKLRGELYGSLIKLARASGTGKYDLSSEAADDE